MRPARFAALAVLAVSLAGPSALAEPGARCGGYAGIKCGEGEWCQRAASRCSATDLSGACARIPQVCSMIFRPVCGCDGKTYGNDCQRQAAQAQLAHTGPCK